MTKPKRTPEEIAAMRAELNAIDAEEAQKMQAEREARYAPLREFVASDAFTEVQLQVRALVPAFRDDDAVYMHLKPIGDFMDRLTAAAGA